MVGRVRAPKTTPKGKIGKGRTSGRITPRRSRNVHSTRRKEKTTRILSSVCKRIVLLGEEEGSAQDSTSLRSSLQAVISETAGSWNQGHQKEGRVPCSKRPPRSMVVITRFLQLRPLPLTPRDAGGKRITRTMKGKPVRGVVRWTTRISFSPVAIACVLQPQTGIAKDAPLSTSSTMTSSWIASFSQIWAKIITQFSPASRALVQSITTVSFVRVQFLLNT